MKKETIDGVDYYVFDQEDQGLKQIFDKAINGPDIIKNLMLALADTAYKLEIEKEDAWQEMKERIKLEFPELPDEFDVEYNRIKGCFVILKQ
jgi:hypothetical protein